MKLPNSVRIGGRWTVEGAGPALLEELLSELEAEVASAGAPVEDFRPPLSAATVAERLAAEGLVAPDELLVWFGWHDGVEEGSFVVPYTMPSLESCLIGYKLNLSVSEDATPFGWYAGWLPVTGSEMYEGLAAWCHPPLGETAVIRGLTADTPLDPAFVDFELQSLCTPVTWWIDSIRSGLFEWRDSNWAMTKYPPDEPERIGFI